MGSYFKPLRRKIGVLTLILACVLAGEWIRCRSFVDEFTFGGSEGANCNCLTCQRNGLIWSRYTFHEFFPTAPFFTSRPIVEDFGTDDPLEGYDVYVIDWRWKIGGFDFTGYHHADRPDSVSQFWIIPYWSIVIPLTVLSAGLLLSKPRQRRKTVQSVPEMPA